MQRWLGSLSLPIRGISNLALRVVLLAGLLPLSMVCFACWALFRKVLPPPEKPAPEEAAGAASGEQPPRKRSLWQRFLDLFRSGPGSAKDGGDGYARTFLPACA